MSASVLVAYATRAGSTVEIAENVAGTLHDEGFTSSAPRCSAASPS